MDSGPLVRQKAKTGSPIFWLDMSIGRCYINAICATIHFSLYNAHCTNTYSQPCNWFQPRTLNKFVRPNKMGYFRHIMNYWHLFANSVSHFYDRLKTLCALWKFNSTFSLFSRDKTGGSYRHSPFAYFIM